MSIPFQGITTETRSVSRVPFDLDLQFDKFQRGELPNPFFLAALTGVEAVARVMKESKLLPGITLTKDQKATPEQVEPDTLGWILQFQYKEVDGKGEFMDDVWAPGKGDPKYDRKEQMLNERVAHIFDAFLGVGAASKYLTIASLTAALGKPIESWQDYLTAIAKVFNTGRDGKPIYEGETGEPITMRLKLVRAGAKAKEPNDIVAPLGNFLELYAPDAPSSILRVTPGEAYKSVAVTKPAIAPKAATFSGQPSTQTKPVQGWNTNDL